MEQFLLELKAGILNAQWWNVWLQLAMLALFLVGYLWFIRLKSGAEFKAMKDNFAELMEQNRRLTQETEQIKRELEKGTIAYQIKLSKYHDRAIASLDEVYSALYSIVSAARQFCSSTHPDSKAFYDIAHNVKASVNRHRLWIDETLYQQMMIFIEQAKEKVSSSMINELQLTNIEAGEESRAEFLEMKGESISRFLTEELDGIMGQLKLEIQQHLKPE